MLSADYAFLLGEGRCTMLTHVPLMSGSVAQGTLLIASGSGPHSATAHRQVPDRTWVPATRIPGKHLVLQPAASSSNRCLAPDACQDLSASIRGKQALEPG